MKKKLKFMSAENLKSRLSRVKKVVKYFGRIDAAETFKNDAKMLVNFNDTRESSTEERALTIKKLCTVDMVILKPDANINSIKSLVCQYAIGKSKLNGEAGNLSDEDKPPIFIGEFSI